MREYSTIAVDDMQMAYRSFGSGTPLVMIMGFGGTMDIWDPQVIEALAAHHRVIVFDNRGVGRTTEGTRPFSIEQFADDTVHLMDALELPQAHVLGWSMGTYIAREAALRHPARVETLVLYAGDAGGTEAIMPAPEVLRVLKNTSDIAAERNALLIRMMFPRGWLKKNFEYIRSIMRGPLPEASDESVRRQGAAWDVWEGSFSRLAAIIQPTLVITGDEDVLVRPENSRMLAAHMPHARLEILKGCGHGAMYQEPAMLAKIVMDFLAG